MIIIISMSIISIVSSLTPAQVEYKERAESSDDEFDDLGRRKKKYKLPYKRPMIPSSVPDPESDDEEEDEKKEEEEEEEDEDVNLGEKVFLCGVVTVEGVAEWRGVE